MNNTAVLSPELTAFLSRVRGHLGDLTDEQRDELLDGLEADLAEQLAAGDPLPDPAAYAVELRSAAGIGAARRTLPRWGGDLGHLLDRAREDWLRLTAHNGTTRQAWSFLEAVRPAWWVLRAWVAVTLLDQATGPWEFVTAWPTLGAPLLGPLVLVAAVVVSVLIGQGRLWPGSGRERTVLARVVLLVLNVLAVLAPLTFSGDGSQQYVYTVDAGPAPLPAGVLHHGRDVVRNIYAYDASGQPLSGVQLFDQAGRPVAVSAVSSTGRGGSRQVTCPWFNGGQALRNVFPLPQVAKRRGVCRSDDAAAATQQAPPLASVPPASATPPVP